ncbi:integrase [Streptomyces sp. or20]|uniref:integrase n=1 Tax=Streptomyces sp. or20 TaxID=1828016 RepID=UPI000BF21B6D|nr:integrase [Streptomyces sp. or20]
MSLAVNPRFIPPAASTFVFDPDLVAEGRRESVPRYGDPIWSVLALTQNPSAPDDCIRWHWFSGTFRETFRFAAWTLVNHPLADQELARHGIAMRAKLSAGRIMRTVHQWSIFAAWLDERGITRLADLDTEGLADFAFYLAKTRGLSRNTASGHLTGLSRLHYYGRSFLPPSDRLVEPPWVAEGMDDYLPAASPLGGENSTEPITPATMGPLLVWALRFVEDYAEDILAAHDERRRLLNAADAADGPLLPDSGDALEAFLEGLEAEGLPVPVAARRGNPLAGAGIYLAAVTGTPRSKVRQVMRKPHWRTYTAQNHGPCHLGTPVNATLDAEPWHEPFTFDGIDKMVRHLATACFIVLSYLTGMRSGEILGLASGCCPDPEGPPAEAGRHLIYGRVFKIATDEYGNHDSAGVVREAPWVAVPQVVTSVRVLERLGGDGLLFAAEVHDKRQPERRSGRSLQLSTLNERIERFIEWVNTHAENRERESEMIPQDTHGRIGAGRFRRTLAWHIARRPGGLVALAVQYGHMRTLVSEGYGSRSRGGIHDLLDFETARSVAEHLSEVHEAIQDGEGISGPAARRLIHSAAQEHHRFGGIITSVRQARSLLADPNLNVFENKDTFLFCNYDRAKALCHPGRSGKYEAPSLDRCKLNCANIARTDTHARQLREAADSLVRQASSGLAPEPLADRMQERAQGLSELADQHDRKRVLAGMEGHL